jgi:hypothetical protein
LPLSGFHTHGYFSYNPLLFNEVAAANQYEVILQGYSKGARASAPAFMRENGFPDGEYYDFGIEFILQKTADAPFRVPLETSTSLGVSDAFLAGTSYARPGTRPDQDGSVRYGGADLGKVDLVRYTGWELQRELLRRYKARFYVFSAARPSRRRGVRRPAFPGRGQRSAPLVEIFRFISMIFPACTQARMTVYAGMRLYSSAVGRI